MFTRSHLQEMKRRYASIYAPPVEEKVIEDGTDEGANQYKKDTPGQDIEKEFKEHCGVCGEQGIEEDEIEEGTALQVKMALSDVGLKGTWKNNKVYVKKKDVKKAEKALKGNVIYRGKPPIVVGEEVEIDETVEQLITEAKGDTRKLADVLSRFVMGDRRSAISQLQKLSKDDFGIIEKPGTKEYNTQYENLFKKLHSALNSVIGEEVEIEEAKKPTRDAGMECMECGKKFRAKLSTLQYGRTKCPKCKSTDLDFAFGESVKEEVELVEKGVAYPPTIDNLRMIVKDKQHQTFMFKSGKAMVDLFTASAMVQVYDALKKPEMKKTFEKMIKDKAGFMKTQAFAMKMIGK